MTNKLELVQTPTRTSGPRHGGTTQDRVFKFYVNGHLFDTFTERSQWTFNYAHGKYLDDALNRYVAKFEAALDCKCLRVDCSRPDPKPEPKPKSHCEHDWRATDNWLIDKCAKCGEERA